jgi:phage-related holin
MNDMPIKDTVYWVWELAKGALIILVGPLNYQLGYLLLVIFLDLLLGVWAAKRECAFDLGYMVTKTIEKITIYATWIVISHAFDMVINLPGAARKACIVILLGREFISSIKNTKKLGYVDLAQALDNMGKFIGGGKSK